MIKNKYKIHNIKELEELAKTISSNLEKGDIIALIGEIGSGKTTLSKFLINQLTSIEINQINSPTFNLYQSYNKNNVLVNHYDFYRIEKYQDLDEIDLEDSYKNGITIIEWADKYINALTQDYIEIHLTEKLSYREYKITPKGKLRKRIKNINSLDNFLKKTNLKINKLEDIYGDASKRKYCRLHLEDKTLILMDSSQEKKKINPTKLSTSISDYIHICKYLEKINIRVPELFYTDIKREYLIEEDFGDLKYSHIISKENFKELYQPAIDTLLHISEIHHPNNLEVNGKTYDIPEYDKKIYLNEVEIFIKFYWPFIKGTICTSAIEKEFMDIWNELLIKISSDKSLVLRDFHSPNLMLLKDEENHKKCGVIDFQDALLGHPIYDLVSLCQDARITISEEEETFLIETYKSKFNFNNYQFDRSNFIDHYCILGTQRSMKILGIFARLSILDSRNDYLVHMPRVINYIKRNMQNSNLSDLSKWLDLNFKEEFYV
ncbi:MAG: tRNA (adenosine(37)-N6)-threonylcarbamoyltransferase complex ATPase subunit type 1 TsaE [Hyphomicrobiales bacterium]|nr:tRNA (adenosine(37)-N6)-threonylcarbamoyltransferase complex ATPase subunit type 1 TsaE [Hyphomicrobiales bacterium]